MDEMHATQTRYKYLAFNIYAVQQDTQSVLVSEFTQHLCLLDMFRTSPVHHQERFISCICRFGMW